MASAEKKSILLTFDVEDWFQVENFKEYIPFSSWDSNELRVERNTNNILDILDSFSFKPRATFFILGWIAKRVPNLVIEIAKRGHEVASHGNLHNLCTHQQSDELFQDLTYSKKLLEDILGNQIFGYRAPNFSITEKSLGQIKKAGYLYDSSYNSFSMHGRYGKLDLFDKKRSKKIYKTLDSLYEIPISNYHIGSNVIPFGGGGYFRLIPFWLFKLGMKSVLNSDQIFVFYAHPWEFDPEQPRVDQASSVFKFRHYINIHKTEFKLKALISAFSCCRFTTCSGYLNQLH